jgi:hypothetical protein
LLLSVSPSNLILSNAWIIKLIQNVSKTNNQFLETPKRVSQQCYSLLGSCKYHPAFTYAEECKCQFYRFITVKKLCLYLAPDMNHENLLHLTSGREWHFQPVLSSSSMRALLTKETFGSSSWYFMAQQTIPISGSISRTKHTLSEWVANVTCRNSGFL